MTRNVKISISSALLVPCWPSVEMTRCHSLVVTRSRRGSAVLMTGLALLAIHIMASAHGVETCSEAFQ